ncbi:MlaD family protein [Saccharicrinis aurantiacus]|uniref:MlaD family protein n=1 Tax=Saccharicrinis aurantiacus TaxID=1849719 RepID=UPI00248F9753|nr:MlaD family protein [Saccharicrinis aurantiacus]
MLKLSKEAKVGLTVLIGFVILIWGINFLKGKGVFSGGEKYYGLYSRVDGLTEASPIFYKGFKVGIVNSVGFSENREDIIVGMNLYSDVQFNKNTIAQIYSLDLMGTKGIRLVNGDSKELLVPGDTLVTSIAGDLADKVSQEVLPLKNKAENLVVKIDSLLSSVNSLFDEANKASISAGIHSFGVTMKNVESMSHTVNSNLSPDGSLGRTMSNIDSLSFVLKSNGEALSGIMNNLNQVTQQMKDAHIDSMASNMNNVLVGVNSMLSDMNSGVGTAGKLLKDEELYYNLNEVATSLDRLLNDVRHQPSRYVRFSAVSFGDGKATSEQNGDIVYKVQLLKVKEPSDIRGANINDNIVNEDRHGKYFIYTIGADGNYKKIEELHTQVKDQYSNSEIIALKDGIPVKVPKNAK